MLSSFIFLGLKVVIVSDCVRENLIYQILCEYLLPNLSAVFR
jgi:hypothetical protein